MALDTVRGGDIHEAPGHEADARGYGESPGTLWGQGAGPWAGLGYDWTGLNWDMTGLGWAGLGRESWIQETCE